MEQISHPDADAAGPDVAAAVRALHRRDGWTRATISSFIACLLGVGMYTSANSQGTPPPSWFLGIVIALAVLTGVSIVAVIVASQQLRRTPPSVIAKFNAAMVAALNDPGLRARLHESGTTPAPSSPAEFGNYLRAEISRWNSVIKEKGLKGE